MQIKRFVRAFALLDFGAIHRRLSVYLAPLPAPLAQLVSQPVQAVSPPPICGRGPATYPLSARQGTTESPPQDAVRVSLAYPNISLSFIIYHRIEITT